jgi:hypothetical protein
MHQRALWSHPEALSSASIIIARSDWLALPCLTFEKAALNTKCYKRKYVTDLPCQISSFSTAVCVVSEEVRMLSLDGRLWVPAKQSRRPSAWPGRISGPTLFLLQPSRLKRLYAL